MKRTIRKIAIVLSMGMLLVLLTSWYSYAQQLPSGLAAGIVINPNNQQQIPLNSNEETSDNLGENENNSPKDTDKASDTDISLDLKKLKDSLQRPELSDTTVDREKIQQEIDESINSIDENALSQNNLKFSNNAGSETLKHVSTAANELIDSWDPKTGVDTLESSLQALVNRTGATLNIEDTDNIVISYVHAGKTYTTSTNVSPATMEKLQVLFNRTFASGTSGPAIGQANLTLSASDFATPGPIALTPATSSVYTHDSYAGLFVPHDHKFENGACTICGKACENSFHTDVCPKCGLRHDGTTAYGGFSVVIGCINLFHNDACPDCGMKDRYSFIFNSGSVISQGHPEIVFGIGGLVIGFFAAMLVFRKRNSTPATAKDKADETKNNDEI